MHDVLQFVSTEKEPVKNWDDAREAARINFHRVGDRVTLTVGQLSIYVSKTQTVVYGTDVSKNSISFKVPAGASIECNKDTIRFYQTSNFYEYVVFASEQTAKTVFIDVTIHSEP